MSYNKTRDESLLILAGMIGLIIAGVIAITAQKLGVSFPALLAFVGRSVITFIIAGIIFYFYGMYWKSICSTTIALIWLFTWPLFKSYGYGGGEAQLMKFDNAPNFLIEYHVWPFSTWFFIFYIVVFIGLLALTAYFFSRERRYY